jgi:hypothetical protein
MGSIEVNRKKSTAAEDVCHAASLTNAMGIMRANECTVPREPGASRSHAQLQPFLFDFIGREPFGFAFTAGREARFRVPAGHRFVVEHVNISCWAKDDHVDVQLVTKSSCRCCNPAAAPSSVDPLPTGEAAVSGAAPIWVQGSSVSTFLFGNTEVHDSPIVPPETYVQVWGYLEPTNAPMSF